ncbi:toll-like receptor 2 [Eublepharis macularius]|uniref:Toll-like receptor 2 n=1 Tax=Eublepharis macularius TaxID=481883 RepID=A0AA97JFC1_EUBMA|nr:toll-like receptor 2 [Eublepharis macularius]XP_054836406.1 toll-like receptor 2 [Eublepharis macularius]
MEICTRVLYFYLVILFCNGEDEFQHPGDEIYVPTTTSNCSSLLESHTPKRVLDFFHVIKQLTSSKGAARSNPEVVNSSHHQNFQDEPTAVLFNSRPQEISGQNSPLKLSQKVATVDSPQTEQSLQNTTGLPVLAEKQQGNKWLLNVNPMLKHRVLDHKRQARRETEFLPSALRGDNGCGILVKGVLNLSHRELSGSNLKEKMDSCNATMDKIRELNASHNHLNIDLTALISLLLEMKNMHSVDVSYNKITNSATHRSEMCNLEPSKLLFLNLSHNPLNTLDKLCLPSTLKSIDLSFTRINKIPKEFGRGNFHLEEIYIQGNHFIYKPQAHGPGFFLQHLRTKQAVYHPEVVSRIDVPQTPIQSLPQQVKRLQMSNCSIVELPKWFANKMEKLLFLDISNNPMLSFPQLPASLQHLDLSNSNIESLIDISHFSNLTVLHIQNNKMRGRFPSEHLPLSLKELDVSKNNLHVFPLQEAQQKIESLNVSRNLVTELYLSISFSSLTHLDMSHNIITELLDHTGKFLPALKYFNLSGNKISVLQPGSLPQSLLELDISNNAITILMKETFKHLKNLQVLTIQGKHFFCNCDLYWFVNTYLSSSQVQINGKEDMLCSYPPGKWGLLVEHSNLTLFNCSLGFQMGITACVAILVISTIMTLCWHFDGPWYIKMGWYWCVAKKKQYEKRPQHKPYDAFISYSEDDAPWIKGTLLEKLETSGFKVCYHERDFKPGHPVLGNIFYCIENSHKVLFVLSPSFVNSCWCQYELYFAEHRVLNENQDSLIMVVLEELPPNSIPQKFSKLRKLLKRKTYLKWSPEEHKQKLFWHQLTAVLKTVNEAMVLTSENELHLENGDRYGI